MINHLGIMRFPSPNPEDKHAGRFARKAAFQRPSSIPPLLPLSISAAAILTSRTLQNLPVPFVPAENRGGGKGEGSGIWGRELPKGMIKELICLK